MEPSYTENNGVTFVESIVDRSIRRADSYSSRDLHVLIHEFDTYRRNEERVYLQMASPVLRASAPLSPRYYLPTLRGYFTTHDRLAAEVVLDERGSVT